MGSLRAVEYVVYHNPSCSKSRGALEILAGRGIDADVVEYLKAPPDRATLERIVDAIPNPPGRAGAQGQASSRSWGSTASEYIDTATRSSGCCSPTPS